MMHVTFYVGLDPASQNFGVCWLDGDGNALEPLESHGTILYGHTTLRSTKSGKAHRQARLDQLEHDLAMHLHLFPVKYLNLLREQKITESISWEIVAFGIEQPSDHYHKDSGGDRHDTQFVNGMSMRMAYTACRSWRDMGSVPIQRLPPGIWWMQHERSTIYEVTPAQTSSLLQLPGNVKKYLRCMQAATWTGGQYEWPAMDNLNENIRMKHANEGHVIGGRLAGAGSDALDAYAAARAAFHLHHEQLLLDLATQQSSTRKEQSHVRSRTRKTS